MSFETKDPVVNLRVFKNRTYATGVFLMAILGVGLYGSLVLIPLVLQTVLGYPPLQAGIAMAPRGLGSFIAMPVVGMILAKVDARKLLILGNRNLLYNSYSAFEAKPKCGILGFLLATVLYGAFARHAFCSSDDDQHGSDPERSDGQRH